MRKNWKGAAAVFAAVAVALALAGCGGAAKPASDTAKPSMPAEAAKGPIKIGSKIDTEGELLATVIQQTLEANGFKVEDKSQTGTTDVVRKALLAGDIDMYPEYTGSGLLFFEGDPAATAETFKDPLAGYEAVKKLDAEKNQVVWLTPAKANNTWAIVATKEFAAANNLKTMSDFTAYVKAGKDVKLAASDEFFNNIDAWPAFAKVYGVDLTKKQRVVFSGGNTAQTEKAVAEGTDGVNFGMAYGTDGALADLGLVVLTDDKEAQLVYWPTPIIRKATLDKYPEIESILTPVFESLTLEKLQELNGRIQVNGEKPEDVAKSFLTEAGFLK
ncbi:MAG TPA: glycine betaine ABC transporter substrate-binding protein [Coriobacteriia bacterium]|nr:glycine betaine ABC transporter substrate-binding protein [Coriobacteriia bacterium]